MAKYIHSTLGADVKFTVQKGEGKSDTPNPVTFEKKILVRGGVGIIIPGGTDIPVSKSTMVTDEEFEIISRSEVFKKMAAEGYLTVSDHEKVNLDAHGRPAELQPKDGTSQISDEDHANGLDPRVGHAGTRASFGEGNVIGIQPVEPADPAFGPVAIA